MSDESDQTIIPEVKIYTDGGCDPNPGRGGYGAVLLHPKKRVELSGGFRRTTNNRMEILAAIKGLELLTRRCKVTVYSDSQYLVKAIMHGWAVRWRKKNWWRTPNERAVNIDLWERLLGLCEKHLVNFVWVRGHAGNKENERCDVLSTAALRKPGLPVDNGYENKADPVVPRERLTDAGQPCWQCATPLIKQTSTKKPKRGYYYEFYLTCPKCKATYRVEDAKRFIDQTQTLL